MVINCAGKNREGWTNTSMKEEGIVFITNVKKP
jgi:hypothetical protein